jgi:hypothetical protein
MAKPSLLQSKPITEAAPIICKVIERVKQPTCSSMRENGIGILSRSQISESSRNAPAAVEPRFAKLSPRST